MNENETLREQMWDLCYGLLAAEDVAALHKQIKSDPAAARLYAEVRLQADLVASAAKVEDVSVTLSVPDEGRKVQPAAKKHSTAGDVRWKSKSERSGHQRLSAPSYRAANWLAGLAAMALVALIGYGFYAPTRPSASHTEDQVVAYVYGNNSLQSGLSQNLKVVAKDRRGEPASAEVSYQVYFQNGKMAAGDIVQTDKDGKAQLSLPGTAVQPGSRLELQVHNKTLPEVQQENNEDLIRDSHRFGGETSKLVVPLFVTAEPVTTDVQLEKDAYQAGETVRFRVHAWGAFSKQPAVAADDWKLVAQDGTEIEPSRLESRPEAGNVLGEFRLPEDAPAGEYKLVGIDRASGAWQEMEQVAVGLEAFSQSEKLRRSFAANSNRQLDRLRELDALALAKPMGKQSEQTDKEKQAEEKGESKLARGGAAPTPLAANDTPAPAPAPAEASGSKPAPPAAPKAAAHQEKKLAQNGVAADAASKADALPDKKEAGTETLHERLSGQSHRYLRSAMKDRTADAAEQEEIRRNEVTVQVPPELAKKKLLVVVSKANSPVTTQEYDGGASVDDSKTENFSYSQKRGGTDNQNAGPGKEFDRKLAESSSGSAEQKALPTLLSLQIPPEADGELEVTLYDQSVRPSQPVYRQQVRRESLRGLNIEVAALQQSGSEFTPQEEMQLKFKVTDQGGKVVPNSWLSARIVKLDDDVARFDSNSPARFAEGKEAAASGSRSKMLAPGLGGGGFGGGRKGGTDGDGDAKDLGMKKEVKKDSLEREVLAKKAQKKEAKLDASDKGSAKPGELAEGDKTSGSGIQPSQDESKQLADAEGPMGGFGSYPTPWFKSEVNQLDIPREALLGSNDGLIQDADRAEHAAAKAARMNFQLWIGRVVLVVAVAALLLLGVLAILHQPAQTKVWVPAMAVVAGSLIVGSVWLLNGKMASLEVAGLPEVRLRENRDSGHSIRPMAPKSMTSNEPAAAFPENAPEMSTHEESKPFAAETLEKYQDRSGGPGIGSKMELPSGGFAPHAESPSPTPAGPAGLAGPLGGEGKTEKAPAPASKPEAAAKPGEPKSGFTRSRTEPGKDSAELQKGNRPQDPQRPAAMKSIASGADRDKRATSPQLLWEPSLPANELGEAELNLQLPSEPGDYVLIVDVQGPNGVGTVQRHIPVRVPPAAPAAAPDAPPKP